MRKRFYAGVRDADMVLLSLSKRETLSAQAVYEASGESVRYLIGPFRTRAGAEVMVNPHGPLVQTVSDCEREAKRRAGL